MDQLGKRTQLIRLRIESLERRKLVLKPHEKWPTVKAVRRYQERKSTSPPVSQLPLSPAVPPPLDPNAVGASSTPKGKEPKTPPPKLHAFHFPISRAGNSPTFPQFFNLPPELRIQIWQLALYVPKFIEAQFCTQFFQPAFVNCGQYNILFSVCHESRAVALASIPDTNALQALTLKSHPVYHTIFLGTHHSDSRGQKPWPNKTIHFRPECDTIFLRSLDNYQQNDLGSFIGRFDGMETIQHLAIPLEPRGIPSRRDWSSILSSMQALKTLTFMIGSKEKSWRGSHRGIELRDVEQWFVDGRSRDVCRGNGGKVDIKDVESYMRHSTAVIGSSYHIGSRSRNRVVNVRVVAWKRGGRS